MIESLDDPDPAVVRKTIEGLEMVGDESLAARLEDLSQHPDPEVRAAAQEAAEMLQ